MASSTRMPPLAPSTQLKLYFGMHRMPAHVEWSVEICVFEWDFWGSSGGPTWALGNCRFWPPYLHTQSDPRDDTHTSRELVELSTCCIACVGRQVVLGGRCVPRNQSTLAQPVGAKTPLLDTNAHVPCYSIESPGTTCVHYLSLEFVLG